MYDTHSTVLTLLAVFNYDTISYVQYIKTRLNRPDNRDEE